MPYEFTEQDFEPKSKFDFTEEDFKKRADLGAENLDFFRRTHPWLTPVQGPMVEHADSLSPAKPQAAPVAPSSGTIGPQIQRPSPFIAIQQQMANQRPITEQPGMPIEEPVGEYRRLHPQTPLEALNMPTQMPFPRISEETGTKIAHAINKLKAVESTPEQDVAGGKIIAGGEQSFAGLMDFLTSTGGATTMMTGGVMGPEVAGARASALAERSVAAAFAADMAKNLPEQTAIIIDAIDRGDTTTATREFINASVSLGVIGHAAKGAVSPLPEARPTPEILRRPGERPAVIDVGDVLKAWAENKRLAKEGIVNVESTVTPVETPQLTPGDVVKQSVEKEPLKPAAEAAQPKEERARTIETPTTLYGDVLSQPVEGKGQVPVKEGESRVQPQTEGGIPKEEVLAPAEQIAKDQGLKFGGEVQGQWQFDVTDPKDGQPIRFNIKAGATPEEVSAKAKSKLQEFSSDLPSGVITEEAMLKMTPEQQFELGHKAGIQYGETLTKESVPDLEKKYSAAKNELMDSLKKGDTKGYGAAFGRMNYYGGALMGATKGEHPISGSNYELYLKQKAAEKPTPKETPKPKPTETVLAARGGTAHGLPAGVPDRGPNFASELMEASRQLGALVRSRSTLRPGVLGQFVRSKLAGIKQADRIEVGDIRNQATVAHEIGHSLDGILFPDQDFGNSQVSLAARVGTGTKKELTQELTKVSELMRGPMTGSAGHVQYRKRATELIADYFSLYAHDRDRAAAMAPKFTKGFEDKLSKDFNTQEVVKGLLSGNVVPKPPNPTLPKALAGITGAAPQGTAAMPGKMPARPILPPPVRERQAAVAAEGLVKDAVRTLESKTQSLRILGENWIKDVPKESDRLDVGAFVEGMGNLSKPADTIDRVRTRMTPAKEQLVKKYRFRQELQRQEINSYLKDTEEGEYLKFLEDYLPHFYVDSAQKIGAAASRFSKESPHAKQRKLPTLKEATELGLTPITQDPAVLIQLSGRINWQVATNRKFVAKLKDIKTGGGGDVVVPKKDNPGNWPTTDNPLIQRVYARQTPNGLMLWRGGAAIHPDVWRAARQILEAPVSGNIGKAYDAINSFTRANAFAFSLFHDLTLRSAAIGSQATAKNPLRGLFRVMEQHPLTGELKIFQSTRGLGKELLQNEEAVADAAQHGLKFSYTDSEAYQHNARTFLERRAAQFRDVPVLGKTARLARDLQQWHQEGLWKNTHDAFKIITYHDLVSKALQDALPGTDTSAVKEQIASFLNDAYGGQEWQTKFWLSPGARKTVSRFLLAPDWCVDGKTRAMTPDGWKYHDELKIGEPIMGFDPKTEKVRWMPLMDKYVNVDYFGQMVCISNYTRSILLTPDHTCYVRNECSGNSKIKKANELTSHDLIPRCAPSVLPIHDAPYTDQFIRLLGWYVTDGHMTKACPDGKAVYFYGKITQSKPDMVALLKSEGMCYHVGKIPAPHFNKSGKPIVTNHPSHKFTIPKSIWSAILQEGLEKGLHWGFLKQLSRRQLILLRSSMLLGDGCRGVSSAERFCGSERDIFNMVLIQTLLGIPSTFSREGERIWRTRTIQCNGITAGLSRTTTTELYQGTIWCPSVESGFWLAERDGLIFVTGNTLSTIRSVPGISDVVSTAREHAPRIAGREAFPTPKEGPSGAGRRLRFWGTEVAALAMATAAAQYAIYKAFGDDKKGDKPFPWENELNQRMRIDVTPIMRKFPWSDPKDPTRHYVNLGKRPQEILNWFTEPDKQIMSKSSRPVAMIFEQVAGSEGDFKAQWKQDHESFLESVGSRAKAIGTEALPFTFRGNQFALSAPVRKGMTKYKAQQAYESVFGLATNPSRIRSLLRGQPPSEGTIPEMSSQITDAAHRNGVPAEEVMVRALSTVRGHHYNEFFKAFQKGDQKKMDEEAKALVVLGATDKGIEEALKRRMELQPQAPQ